jgi:hypothetical protein
VSEVIKPGSSFVPRSSFASRTKTGVPFHKCSGNDVMVGEFKVLFSLDLPGACPAGKFAAFEVRRGV